jgi:hypothetical protein
VRERLVAAAEGRALPGSADRVACREAVLVADQLARSVKETGSDASNAAVDAALVAGFVDRIAFKLERERPHCALAGRRRVELSKESLVHEAGFVVALEVRESGPEHDRLVSIPVAHPVPREAIERALPAAFSAVTTTAWNKDLRAVEVADEERFLDTPIARKARSAKPSPEVERELVARIKSGEIKLEGWDEHCEPWIARVRCVGTRSSSSRRWRRRRLRCLAATA